MTTEVERMIVNERMSALEEFRSEFGFYVDVGQLGPYETFESGFMYGFVAGAERMKQLADIELIRKRTGCGNR